VGKTARKIWQQSHCGQECTHDEAEAEDGENKHNLGCIHLSFGEGAHETEMAVDGGAVMKGLMEKVAERERNRREQQQRQEASHR
jgi:hypothetical protein